MAHGNANTQQVRILAVLALVNLVNYVDRQLIFPLFPAIKLEFGLTYYQLGWLATVFALVHSLATLPLGMLADRTSRKAVISYGVLFWSAATFLSGLAGSFRSLLAFRGLVGLGEAAYTPSATAIITATFPREKRARMQGIYDTGMFIGGALGIALGGIICAWVGWRPAFFIVGIPGLLLGLCVFRLPATPRPPAAERIPVRALLRVPAYLAVLAGGWFLTFAAHAYITWGPEFVSSSKGFSIREAGVVLGLILVVAGALGVLTGAWLADRLALKYAWGRVLAVVAGFIVCAPVMYGAFHAGNKMSLLVCFFLGVFFMSWYHGPVTATIHDLVPERAHATAMGLYYLFVNLFATTLAPVVTGKLADRYGMLNALHVALAAQVVGALCFAAVILLIRRDGLHHPALSAYRANEVPPDVAGAAWQTP